MPNIAAYAATSSQRPVGPSRIDRREPGAKDVVLDVLFCGVCHSDLHQVRDEWGGAVFPLVPGHEIIGRVTKVGAEVKKLAVGDLAGVGCFVDSCGVCEQCRAHREAFCEKGVAFTYNSTEMDRKTPTYGGYSTQVVVREPYVLKIPKGMDPARTAPLLCAGITTYSPLKQWKVEAGQKVAVLGLGGLGHMGVKLAAALGAEVTVLSSSRTKEADAKRLGATGFEVTSEAAAKLANRFDLILDTVSAAHDYGRDAGDAEAAGHPGAGGGAAQAGADFGVLVDQRQQALRGLEHRWHRRDAGDAGLLRRPKRAGGRRGDTDSAD